ncbi:MULTISPECIES: hypothetical protein [Burkholderia cepacia complex]|uniref:hypothetical protein n=1 Tax=Burkholderia cepacia complex TaxID=87882 RepID=UPI0006786824|nr:hypothetical protein [Burkholderia cenocepacia]KWU23486.1 hypothetical protein AS149_36890 [Burkholderia cenocepacia]RQV54754.1 hypothetical protein DF024_32235 [Burkholderia cenocepacia]CAG2360781.1 hypothetical protein BCCR75389_06051 [Burkholderia cenocepacia]CAG2360789.1 hypothetical protein BCCR75388_06076 [Burkholderia cenocepacia]CAG2360814.1 hypothetical protein BCCR12632_06083 [Burkholderia cenocepacia]
MRTLPRESNREARRVWLPLVLLSILAGAVWMLQRDLQMEELGRSALFDIVMTIAVLGVTGFAGIAGCAIANRVRGRENDSSTGEGYCFVGAVIGTVVFFVAMIY